MTAAIQKVGFVVVPGRGAASGKREYQDLGGSIRAQKPLFKQRGVDLDAFYEATLNLKIAARGFEVLQPLFRIRDLLWLPGYPGENFDLCNCCVSVAGVTYPALTYYPRPETKGPYAEPAPDDIVEVLAPFVPGLTYGTRGHLMIDAAQLRFERPRSVETGCEVNRGGR